MDHQHYRSFSFHPGITALIACCVILLALVGYLWSDRVRQGVVTIRTWCRYFPVANTRNETGSDAERTRRRPTDSLLKETIVAETDSENQLLDGKNCKVEEEVQKSSAGNRIDSLLAQSTNRWSVSMSPINTKSFPESPIIILTPATPLPQHHLSMETLRRDSSLPRIDKLGNSASKDFSSSEELCLSVG